MNYVKYYDQLINKRAIIIENKSIITHKHHIKPRYMGGDDNPNNIVRLTIKDHAFAHWLLYKIHRNLEDKVAYKMLSGKTAESEELRKKLAVSKLPIEKMREKWKTHNPSRDPKNVKKAIETKRKKYNGNIFSEKGLANIRNLCNSGKQHSPNAIRKRIEAQQATAKKLGKEGRAKIYGRFGEMNGNFGKKRPGSLAGNFGTSKGTYTIYSPSGDKTEFSSLRRLMDFGISENAIKAKRNTGNPIEHGKWIGYIIEYIPNPKYGADYKEKQQIYGQ